MFLSVLLVLINYSWLICRDRQEVELPLDTATLSLLLDQSTSFLHDQLSAGPEYTQPQLPYWTSDQNWQLMEKQLEDQLGNWSVTVQWFIVMWMIFDIIINPYEFGSWVRDVKDFHLGSNGT